MHEVVAYRVNVQSLETDFTKAIKMWEEISKMNLRTCGETLLLKQYTNVRSSLGQAGGKFIILSRKSKQIDLIGVIDQRIESSKKRFNKQLTELRNKLLIV